MRKLNEVMKQEKYNKYFNTAETNLRNKNKIKNVNTLEIKKNKIEKEEEFYYNKKEFDVRLFNDFM